MAYFWNSITPGCVTADGIPTISCVTSIFRVAVTVAIGLAGTVALILIMVAGVRYITSSGGKEAEAAQKMLTYALIGLIVVLLSFFIVGLISGFTDVPCILRFGFNSCK